MQTKRKDVVVDSPKNFEKRNRTYRILYKIGLEIIRASWITFIVFIIGSIFMDSSIFVLTTSIIIPLIIFIIGITFIIIAYIYKKKLMS